MNKIEWYLIRVTALIGIALFILQSKLSDRAASCSSDFANFYTGAKLAFSGHIYSAHEEQLIQHEILSCSGPGYEQFIRLPYFAAMLWPLAQLPFSSALAVWRALCAGSILGFVWLWPGPRWRTLAVCVWSLPLVAAFTYGQDVPILLLAMAVSFSLIDRGREFHAGMCLAMGAAKPHLFLILVLVILVRRWWRLALGLCTGGVIIAAASFLTAGLWWPRTFWATITGPGGSPHAETMINLHGLLYSRHFPAWVEAAVTIIILAVVWRACLRAPARLAVPLALAAGVLLGGHSYLYDLTFCIPLTLVLLASDSAPDWLKWGAAIFASPSVYLLPFVSAAMMLVLFVVLVAITFSRDETRPPSVELPALTPA